MRLAQPALRAHRVLLVHRVLKEYKVLDHGEYRVLLDRKALREIKAKLAPRE